MVLFLKGEIPKLEDIIEKYDMTTEQEQFFKGVWLHIFVYDTWESEGEVWERAEQRYVAKYGRPKTNP